MTDIRTQLREQVQARRKELGLSWSDMADRLDYTDESTAAHQCTFREYTPNLASLARIAAALGCELRVELHAVDAAKEQL